MDSMIAFLVIGFSLIVHAGGGLYYHIDNEATVVDTNDPWRLYQDNTYNMVGDGSTNVFNTILESHPNDSLRPWTTASTYYKGGRSLVFRWNATSNGVDDVKDKVMYAIGPHYDSMPGVNDWDPDSVLYANGLKYVGFALCIPSTNFMALRNGFWTMLFQSYQVNALLRPPFAMHISRSNQTASTVDLLFLIRNDDTNYVQQTGNTENARESILIPNIKRNTWYEFVIRLKPSLSETNGNVMVWMAEGDNLPSSSSTNLNSYRKVNYNGSWGYDVGTNTPTFSQQIGLYSSEVNDRPASIYVDEMKYGTTFDLVNP
jgi:hypothetical protein